MFKSIHDLKTYIYEIFFIKWNFLTLKSTILMSRIDINDEFFFIVEIQWFFFLSNHWLKNKNKKF